MKFLADECVYLVTTQLLRRLGHDVVTAQEAGLAGQPDEKILAYATAHERVLITIDMDFSNIRRYPPKTYTGIVVLKIRPRNMEAVHQILARLIDESVESLSQALVIVDQTKYRIR